MCWVCLDQCQRHGGGNRRCHQTGGGHKHAVQSSGCAHEYRSRNGNLKQQRQTCKTQIYGRSKVKLTQVQTRLTVDAGREGVVSLDKGVSEMRAVEPGGTRTVAESSLPAGSETRGGSTRGASSTGGSGACCSPDWGAMGKSPGAPEPGKA